MKKKNFVNLFWWNNSTFMIAFGKNILKIAQFPKIVHFQT